MTGVSVSGKFIVTFDAYAHQEEVERGDLKERALTAAAGAVANYKGAPLVLSS